MSRIIPFGDRILVKRKTVGEKAGSIFLPEDVQERPTDLAVVVHVPELSFTDRDILANAEEIVEALTKKAREGDSNAITSLMSLNEFCRWKSIQPGDEVMIGKYVGTTFIEKGKAEELTLVLLSDIIGLVIKETK